MHKMDLFDIFADQFTAVWKYNLVQGILLLALGILILIFPGLLIAMAASFFMVLGVIFLGFAWRGFQFQKKYEGWRIEFHDSF